MGKKLNVEGIAVVEGISRNKVMYQAFELDKFAPSLIGRPILKDHVNLTDNIIGKVTHSESINGGKKVRFKGWIVDDGKQTLEKVQEGLINHVSIGAQAGKMVKEKEDSEYIIAKDMTALELSLTPVPGVPDASITPSENSDSDELDIDDFDADIDDEELEEMVLNGISILNESLKESHSQLNLNKEEINMEGNEVKENTQVSEDAKTILELQSKLDEALKVIETYKESERKTAIDAYNKMCAEKGITALDVSSATMETIKAFSAMVDSIKLPVKEDDEEPKTEDIVEEPKEEEKPVEEPKEKAKTKVVEKIENSQSESANSKYVTEYSTLGGMAFFKSY